MAARRSALRFEELEQRLLLKAPWDAPPLGPPPGPGPNVIWVNTENDLRSAFRNLQSGQTVVIEPGVYDLSETLYLGDRGPVQNVLIRGATDNFDNVVLLGRGMENPDFGPAATGISVLNAQDVTIANLSIGEVYFHPIHLHPNEGSNRIHVYHTRLFNAGEQFVKSSSGRDGGVNNSSVEYSVLEYTQGPPLTDHGGGTGYTNGVDVLGGNNWIIRHNLFRNFHTPDWTDNRWNPAILMWNFSSNTLVEGNTFINTDRAIAFGLDRQSSGSDHRGGIIRNNFVYQTPGLFSDSRRDGSDGQIIIWDSPDSQVYHNTILTNGNSLLSIEVRWSTDVQIRNNLTDASIGARSGGSYIESGNYTWASPDFFVDPANGDLHLALNEATLSLVVDQAARLDLVSDDWDGEPRRLITTDIGASELRVLGPAGGLPAFVDFLNIADKSRPLAGPGSQVPEARLNRAALGADFSSAATPGAAIQQPRPALSSWDESNQPGGWNEFLLRVLGDRDDEFWARRLRE